MGEPGSSQRSWALVELAENQEGLVRHAQLVALGFTSSTIGRWLDDGRLHRRHRGVYSVGHRLLRPRGAWMAAVWAVPGCVLGHQSAAAFHGWVEPGALTQHVTTIRRARSRAGLVVHRVEVLTSRDVLRVPSLAVTTPARTIVDLATVLPYAELRAICDRVRDLDVPAIRAAQRRLPHRRGAVNVRRLCERLDAHTRSEFERRYLRFCRRHGVPLPDAVNPWVAGSLVDCRYDARRIIVELDGRAFHGRRDQMRRDRRRDRRALRAGWATVRFVWEDFDDDAATETRADLLHLLGPR